MDGESQGVSSDQKSRRRGTIGEEEEELSWLLFKCRETKAEMRGREGKEGRELFCTTRPQRLRPKPGEDPQQ